MNPVSQRVRRIITTLKRTHPDARLALDFSSPLELLVALILAAQCRDALVNTVTADLFKQYRTPKDWTNLKEEDVSRINFYRGKAKSIQNAARLLIEKFDGKVPDNIDDLLTLPGVGRKTANAVLANAFGKSAIVVDTHVWRLSQRLGLTKLDNADKIEMDLVKIVPEPDWTKFCHLLQYHGRRVCTAKSPVCYNCSITELCPWPEKTPEPKK